jgi:hypothetical protein
LSHLQLIKLPEGASFQPVVHVSSIPNHFLQGLTAGQKTTGRRGAELVCMRCRQGPTGVGWAQVRYQVFCTSATVTRDLGLG